MSKPDYSDPNCASKVWIDMAKGCVVCGEPTCLRVCSSCREAAIEWAAKEAYKVRDNK